MGKRSNSGPGNQTKKPRVGGGNLDPGTRGIFATCNRGRERGSRKELMGLLMDKIDQMYPEWQAEVEEENDDNEENEENEDFEAKVQAELAGLKNPPAGEKKKKHIVEPIDLSCECLVFVKVRRPADPYALVHRLCSEAYKLGVKSSRFTQKLKPISDSVSASLEELKKLAQRILKPHFHADNQKPVKFAIQVNRRNFNALERDDIINNIATIVGRDHGHTVDLKNYDKLIIVECFKSNIGMSVVEDFMKFERFNLEQIFDKHLRSDTVSRVKPAPASEALASGADKDHEAPAAKETEAEA